MVFVIIIIMLTMIVSSERDINIFSLNYLPYRVLVAHNQFDSKDDTMKAVLLYIPCVPALIIFF